MSQLFLMDKTFGKGQMLLKVLISSVTLPTKCAWLYFAIVYLLHMS